MSCYFAPFLKQPDPGFLTSTMPRKSMNTKLPSNSEFGSQEATFRRQCQ